MSPKSEVQSSKSGRRLAGCVFGQVTPARCLPLDAFRAPPRAFTLIEVMVVVGIMGIILAMGVPSILRAVRKEGMRKAVSDVVEVCSNARARAILSGQETSVVFHPRERRLELGGAGLASGTPRSGEPGSPEIYVVTPPPAAAAGTSAVLPEDIIIEGLGINWLDWTEAEEARVRFFPNGTSDEMTLVLRSQRDKPEWRMISLEITTGLADVESDPLKFGKP